jgi:hypothetical protein
MKKLAIAAALMLLSVGAQGFADETRTSGTNNQAIGAVRDSYRAASDPARSSSDGASSKTGSSNTSARETARSNDRVRTTEHNR